MPRRVLAACLLALAVAGSAQAARPLRTAIVDPSAFEGAHADLALERARAAGASVIRVPLVWRVVAPATRPAGFDPRDPDDPAYDWAYADNAVSRTLAHGLEPLVTVSGAPRWAQALGGGTWPNWKVQARAFGDFAHAAATRYSGATDGLPRVRLWQAWNEPNLSLFLNPQYAPVRNGRFDTRAPVSPGRYRALLRGFSAAVHGVHPDNRVVAGGLGPYGAWGPRNYAVAPLLFMRRLFCLSRSLRPAGRCAPLAFDVWATNPYTSGSPVKQAVFRDDVEMGDLPEMRRVLTAARRAGRIRAPRGLAFWATEFGWDTNPPDRWAVPLSLHARWTAEALHRMWLSGITLATWYGLRDEAPRGRRAGAVLQSGLYFRSSRGLPSDRPKPALRAFRFPVVAVRRGRGIAVWVRTPGGEPGRVTLEQRIGRAWRRVATVPTDRYGIVRRSFARPPRGWVRGRVGASGETSLPFALARPRERLVNPFGGPVVGARPVLLALGRL